MARREEVEEVRCVDFWCNEFGMRARIALKDKRVGFEFVEEDLRVRQRSDLVRRMNPVHRSIPILIHNGRPVCGSMNIVEYVDEVWGETGGARLAPADPLERARARFWADFVDQKVYPAQTRFFTSRGEEKAAAMAELMSHLRRMEATSSGSSTSPSSRSRPCSTGTSSTARWTWRRSAPC